jgi:hypothetical protein
MRIRSIKPEFWRSDDIDRLDWATRLLFIGLWSYVDDNGVGRDRESDIAADLFSGDLSRDPRDTLATVSGGLQKLSEGGQIARYTVEGKSYLFVNSWAKHQRIDKPAKGRYPLPTCEDAIPRETLATPSREVRDTPAPGTGEQGNRGTGEEEILSDKSDETEDRFEEFYRLYPRKEAKQDARKAWGQITKKIDPQTVIDGLTAYVFNPDPKFRPLAASWLRGQRWEDEASVHQLHGPGGARKQQVLVGGDYWRDVTGDEVVIGRKTRWVSA